MSYKSKSRDKYPCFNYPGGCPNRSPGCQSKCIEMLCAELAADDRKRTDRRNRLNDNAATGVAIEGHARTSRKKLRER